MLCATLFKTCLMLYFILKFETCSASAGLPVNKNYLPARILAGETSCVGVGGGAIVEMSFYDQNLYVPLFLQ
jgi:hypothetical protein